MDTTQPAANTDLIAQKSAEFDNFPALVLGLDGWILRSLPKHLRAQFLNSYEKLLRTIFHPDRFVDPVQKKSREIYLQNIGEAVRFMLADEFSFEMMVDTVPSRKNPMVGLRHAIEVRDNIINRLDTDLKDRSSVAATSADELNRLKLRLLEVSENATRRATSDYMLRRIVNRVMRGLPVPIDFPHMEVTGAFLDIKPSEFMIELGHYASRTDLSEVSLWISNATWKGDVSRQKLLGPTQSIKLRRGASKRAKLSIVGAMTIAHLCEYVRARTGFKNELSEGEILRACDALTRPIADRDDDSAYWTSVAPFLLRFFSSKMLLLVRFHQQVGIPVRHRLFVVEDVDAAQDRSNAVIRGLKQEVADINKQMWDQKEYYQHRLAVQSRKIAKLEKEAKESCKPQSS